jgi:hypothetical protein
VTLHGHFGKFYRRFTLDLQPRFRPYENTGTYQLLLLWKGDSWTRSTTAVPHWAEEGRKKKGKLEYLALPAAVRGEEEQLAGLVHSCRMGPELFLKKTT